VKIRPFRGNVAGVTGVIYAAVRKTTGCVAIAVVAVCSSTNPAWGALGQARDSVKADAQTLKGSVTIKDMPGYSVHQITRPDGAVLREYVSQDDRIFAVVWQGPTMPNLPQLLGSTYPTFQQATQGTNRRGPLSVRVPGLVVETSGHPRAFRVRAYLTNLLPEGVTEDALQ